METFHAGKCDIGNAPRDIFSSRNKKSTVTNMNLPLIAMKQRIYLLREYNILTPCVTFGKIGLITKQTKKLRIMIITIIADMPTLPQWTYRNT